MNALSNSLSIFKKKKISVFNYRIAPIPKLPLIPRGRENIYFILVIGNQRTTSLDQLVD